MIIGVCDFVCIGHLCEQSLDSIFGGKEGEREEKERRKTTNKEEEEGIEGEDENEEDDSVLVWFCSCVWWIGCVLDND